MTSIEGTDIRIEENRQIAKVFYEKFQKRDWEGMKSFFSSDYSYHLAGTPASSYEVQEKRLMEIHQGFPDLHVIVHRIIADRENAAVIFTIEGTQTGVFVGVKPSGKKVHVASVGLFRFDNNGKINQYHEMFHLLRLLEQIGALPPRSDGW